MTEQLDTSAAAIAALMDRANEWWDYDHGNIFKDVSNILPALSAELTALRVERDAALARVEVLEAALVPCVKMLIALNAESGRGVEFGEEDAFRMGEWFEKDDIAAINIARTALAKGETL